MPTRPEDDRPSPPPADGVVAQPAAPPTSLLLVGSLLKPEGEQELVRVKATVDAPLDATCIRRVRKLLEALSRTMLSRDRSRWDRIDQAREILGADEAEQEAPTERTCGAEALTERRIRVPSDGAPAGVGLHGGHGSASPEAAPAPERGEAPTRRVRIASEPSPQAANSTPPVQPSPRAGAPAAAATAAAALPPPRPKPSPWATTSVAGAGGPAKPALPFPARDRSIPMVLGSEAARLAGGNRPPSLLGSPPSGPARPASFDDARVHTVAVDGPGLLIDPLPFRAQAPQPVHSPSPAEAPAAPGATHAMDHGAQSGGAERPDDADLPTITVDSLPRAVAPPSRPRSTSQQRQSEPIEETLARLARAAGEAISPRSEPAVGAPPAAATAPAAPPPPHAGIVATSPEQSGGATAYAPGSAVDPRADAFAGDEGATVATTGSSIDEDQEPLSAALAAITVETYAVLCAETALQPHLRPIIHHRYRIASEQQRAALDRRWRARLDTDETLARQWRWHYTRHEQSLKKAT